MKEFHNLTIEESLLQLNSSRGGLDENEALARLAHSPVKDIESDKKTSLLRKFLEQFKDLMILILLIAAGVSILIGATQGAISEILDGVIILAIVLMNAIFGVVQENKAEKSLAALKKLTLPEAVVLRGGEPIKLGTDKLVVGDVVVLEAGTIIPADVRIIESAALQIDEASLTGESMAVRKDGAQIYKVETPLADRRNMAYRGTSVTNGRGLGLIVAVGEATEIGKIARAIKEVDKETTPLQRSIKDVGKLLTVLVLAVAAITFFLEVVARPGNVLEAFLTAVAISVAAIPESMPAVITIIMSLGVARLAKQKAVVKRMHSVETLGCCDVICSDKTGTITQNKMTVMAVYCDGSLQSGKLNKTESFDLLLNAMLLCNDTKRTKGKFVGDPTEIALADFGTKFGLDKVKLEKSYPRQSEIPFDSRRKLMSVANQVNGEKYCFTKGAVDSLMSKCNRVLINGRVYELSAQQKDAILHANSVMAEKALRVLALAYKPIEGGESLREEGLIFIGMVGMIDPPRKEIYSAVQKCLSAGMRPVMITGDHKETAFAIAKEIGFVKHKSEVMTGVELDKLSDDELVKVIGNVGVFARVSPENKVRIVDALKSKGHIVSMTGDGVNDAPSLKRASIGIGMGQTGTDVTKEVSDIIVTDDNFATIVIAVEEGRKIYQNIQKTVKFLFSANMGEMLSLFLATVIFPQYVYLFPVQILFVNLITDSLPAIALGVEEPE
ncbi:MAG: HAD-IC family P-type ATPase, partial [Acetobacter sp.]|nr:HAD-IC family P-type ATPase [Acetobacter sp.]